MSVLKARRDAITSTIETIRAAIAAHGISRRLCEEAADEVTKLAAHPELFPARHFPIAPKSTDGFYLLHADRDGTNALYLSVGQPGNKQSPHNHLAWAAIAGISGAEHHCVFERVPSDPAGSDTLNKLYERTVGARENISFMPDEFHSLEVTSNENAVHLHMYGARIEHVPDRTGFNIPGDGSIRRFKYGGAVLTPIIAAEDVATLGRPNEDYVSVEAGSVEEVPDTLAQSYQTIVIRSDDHTAAHAAAIRLWEAGASEVFVLET
jgi:predicted metal-dependent enzyme (double-stranded beta helix superfamily)